jgi:hypothetical protein
MTLDDLIEALQQIRAERGHGVIPMEVQSDGGEPIELGTVLEASTRSEAIVLTCDGPSGAHFLDAIYGE